MYNVFISYLREDKTQALRLAAELRSNGAVVWVDVSDLLTGTPWREEIAEAIREAEFFLACFSSTYEEQPDNGMLEELNYVIKLRRAGQKYPEILPVKLNACDIPDIQIDSDTNLNELHWCLLDDESWEAGVRQLTEITLRLARERAKIRLRAEAEEVVVKNSELVRAREEATTSQIRAIRQRVYSQVSQSSQLSQLSPLSQPYSADYGRRFEQPEPEVWPAQEVIKQKMEYEYALSQYRKSQVEFVERFGEEYDPLAEFSDKMDEDAKRIHKSFEDARQAEEASTNESVAGKVVLTLVVVLVLVALMFVWNWLKSVLGF